MVNSLRNDSAFMTQIEELLSQYRLAAYEAVLQGAEALEPFGGFLLQASAIKKSLGHATKAKGLLEPGQEKEIIEKHVKYLMTFGDITIYSLSPKQGLTEPRPLHYRWQEVGMLYLRNARSTRTLRQRRDSLFYQFIRAVYGWDYDQTQKIIRWAIDFEKEHRELRPIEVRAAMAGKIFEYYWNPDVTIRIQSDLTTFHFLERFIALYTEQISEVELLKWSKLKALDSLPHPEGDDVAPATVYDWMVPILNSPSGPDKKIIRQSREVAYFLKGLFELFHNQEYDLPILE